MRTEITTKDFKYINQPRNMIEEYQQPDLHTSPHPYTFMCTNVPPEIFVDLTCRHYGFGGEGIDYSLISVKTLKEYIDDPSYFDTDNTERYIKDVVAQFGFDNGFVIFTHESE